ncbi:MAG: hypothetical protein IJ784_01995 [Ruminiclostridium sp.]|nr:hypothetical protein [Ruminiclostridium sp.]
MHDQTVSIRNCYNSTGDIITDSDIRDFTPLKELLETFSSLRSDEHSVQIDEAG